MAAIAIADLICSEAGQEELPLGHQHGYRDSGAWAVLLHCFLRCKQGLGSDIEQAKQEPVPIGDA